VSSNLFATAKERKQGNTERKWLKQKGWEQREEKRNVFEFDLATLARKSSPKQLAATKTLGS
jgi:hypothetical protein